MLTEPRIVSPPARKAAVVHFTIPRGDIEREMDRAIQEILAAIAKQNQTPAGPLFAHHLSQSSERFDCEVGFPLNEAIVPIGRVKPSTLPGTTAIFTTYTGDYTGLFDAWRDFGSATKAQLDKEGYVHGPTLWECYVLGPEAEANPDRWKTELYQSIRRNESQ